MRKGILALEENAEIVDLDVGTGEGETGTTDGGTDNNSDGAAGDVTTDVIPFEESAEAPIIEMNESADEILELDDGIDQANTVADTLTEIADTAERTIPDGGLSDTAADVMEISTEALMKSIGCPPAKQKRFALEGFKDKATRVTHTKLAVEDLKTTVNNIYKAVENTLKRIIEWCKKFIGSLVDSAQRLEKRAQAVAAKAKGLRGKKAAADATVSAASFGSVLHIGGSIDEAAIGKYISETFSGINKLQQTALKNAETLNKNIHAVLESKGKTEFSLSGIDGLPGSGGPAGYVTPQGTEVTHFKLGFGDKAIYVVSPTSTKGLKNTKVWLDDIPGAKEFKEETVEVLTPESVEAKANGVAKAMADLTNSKAILAELEKVGKDTLASVKKLASSADVEGEALANINKTSDGVKAIVRLLSGFVSASRQYEIKVGKAILDYGVLSLKAIG